MSGIFGYGRHASAVDEPCCLRKAWLLLAVACALTSPVAASDALPVTVQPFSAMAVSVERSAPATVHPLARATISARLAAPVETLHVDVGDEVVRGDALLRLECDDFEDRLEQEQGRLEELEARRRLAEARAERAVRLYRQQAISDDERDAAEAERDAIASSIRAQHSTVASVRRDVDRCDIAAPFAAIIEGRRVDEGEFVQPGTPLLELVDRERLEVSARLTGDDAETLAVAESIRLRVDGRDHPLNLRRIVPVEDGPTRLREARLRIEGDKPVPGSAGRIHWRVTDQALPADMLVRRNGALGVMVADGNRARFHPIPGAIEGRPAAADDLGPDTLLIVDGRFAAADGAAIRRVDNDG